MVKIGSDDFQMNTFSKPSQASLTLLQTQRIQRATSSTVVISSRNLTKSKISGWQLPCKLTTATMSFADRVSDYTEKFSQFLNQNQSAVRLTLTVVASSALTATSILGYQAVRRRKKVRSIKAEVAAAPAHSTVLTSFGTLQPSDTEKSSFASKEFEESLIHEQLSRNIAFLGKENVEKIRKSFVIVVGAGGVGSWAALMLLRSGVERIRIIDFDQVTLSSLNRHAVATQADVGTPKVKAIHKHFKQIMPQADVDARIELFSMANADDLLDGGLNRRNVR